MELQGKYGKAIVYTDNVEDQAISQIINLLNQPMAEGAEVRIMPDCHAGAGCVIGYTAKLTDKIVPNLIGVDISCGVTAFNLGKNISLDFQNLDNFIRENIPSGRNINSDLDEGLLKKVYASLTESNTYEEFKNAVLGICATTGQQFAYVMNSIGTLGGGNHFIEMDEDSDGNYWVTIHSGSRNFGLKIAKWYQLLAEESILGFDKDSYDAEVEKIKKTKSGKEISKAIQKLRDTKKTRGKATGLEYLEGREANLYFQDMAVAQVYAALNRRTMLYKIVTDFFGRSFTPSNIVESVHNYINFEDNVIRKGAISAHAGEKVIIPLNMADGIIIGEGLGNPDYNYSAAHGAGRIMSRSKAKEAIDVSDYQKIMDDNKVWTSCIGRSTLDEAPQAYKPADEIKGYLSDTVKILTHMKVVYNFKASE